ncbi:MAG: SDR family oxidoreductase, partial [Ruthenibacterium sp.]
VMPSMMETKFLAETSDLIVQASAEANPMKRNARVSDVVPAMEFLLGEDAGFITGVVLPVTGGSAAL